ncbi:hypothetical protein SAMN05216421_2940 [Halopseudomonas xinjiangensis]|uniref:NADH:ubiquinone oxidoreductase n=1 Tax=Halopseudomonas xinjiangensis TaxID=487184 RepID=A0A1H1XSY7_9GAMM|nr:hypothetical protein [Halopseudomonas xinjiangensis]SDT11866.1 hypothetical protein SAMN05216421_2940 [Halopseudomonas xinjiangensis]
MTTRRFTLPCLLLAVCPALASAEACLIESNDDGLPIRMCQQNISIPPHLFESSFCQPEIPQRTFHVSMVDACPTEAYGICEGSRTEGVAYQQSIHYYSEPDDAPVLRAYCEKISQGVWRFPD